MEIARRKRVADMNGTRGHGILHRFIFSEGNQGDLDPVVFNSLMFKYFQLCQKRSYLEYTCVTVCFGIPRTSGYLIALSPGYRVPSDLATVPYVPRYTRFALTEAAMSDQTFETTLLAL